MKVQSLKMNHHLVGMIHLNLEVKMIFNQI